MEIDHNRMVSLIYMLRETDTKGRILEELQESKPLNFVFGTGKLLPAFENHILSLKTGDGFSFNLSADKAYGERREEMINDVPISVFENEGNIDENVCRVGNEVPMVDGSGNPFNGIIIEISEEIVRMDFNHPMAGVDLFFSGKIIDVREATEEEIAGTNHACSSCGSSDNQKGCSLPCG
ncbi:MAG: peptidylprolyl isomerase [Odoribacter sp.]|nr:peptidylprolyl isomerase [Odoribacter sp.]